METERFVKIIKNGFMQDNTEIKTLAKELAEYSLETFNGTLREKALNVVTALIDFYDELNPNDLLNSPIGGK